VVFGIHPADTISEKKEVSSTKMRNIFLLDEIIYPDKLMLSKQPR